MTTTFLFKSGSGNEQSSSDLGKRMFTGLTSSVRVPVTSENREYLRALRRAELAAWRSAPGGTLCRQGSKK